MMLTGKFRWLPLVFSLLCVTAQGQEMRLEPGRAVESEIVGGQSHTYQINLAAGQFVRLRLDQRVMAIGDEDPGFVHEGSVAAGSDIARRPSPASPSTRWSGSSCEGADAANREWRGAPSCCVV